VGAPFTATWSNHLLDTVFVLDWVADFSSARLHINRLVSTALVGSSALLLYRFTVVTVFRQF
jgi:hypothetical protein